MIWLNFFMILVLPFIWIGLIQKSLAFFSGRKGSSLIQPMRDFIKLMHKSLVYSTTTTPIFRVMPVLGFFCSFLILFFVPMINHHAIFSFIGDFIVVIGILSLAKWLMIAAAFDTGSSFEGMGASREVMLHAMTEPALIILTVSLSSRIEPKMLVTIFPSIWNATYNQALIAILASIACFILMLIEGCRIPVDDPRTHLELTMIHEVMVLDHSGSDLGLIQWANYLKLFFFGNLIIAIFIPQSNIGLAILYYLLGFCILGILIAFMEFCFARFRIKLLPQFTLFPLMISILVSIFIFVTGGIIR